MCMLILRKLPTTDFSKSLNSIEKPPLYAWISYQIERKNCEKIPLNKINNMQIIKQSVGIDVSKDTLEVQFKGSENKRQHPLC